VREREREERERESEREGRERAPATYALPENLDMHILFMYTCVIKAYNYLKYTHNIHATQHTDTKTRSHSARDGYNTHALVFIVHRRTHTHTHTHTSHRYEDDITQRKRRL
jgi:hypothetical protein